MNFKLNVNLDNASREKILNWTLSNYKNLDYFVKHGSNYRYCSINKFDTEITDLVNRIAEEKLSLIHI
jgi:hypothetical protein